MKESTEGVGEGDGKGGSNDGQKGDDIKIFGDLS